ncbi:FecR family protein [Chitinophaga jiangningensis]|uniref:FecR family protein n=1 Tax=Chitinophaga jiangningensis TaxID=1419482 RepID=A0A1M6Y5B0_9BACT|nr:FecR family protein [Chitinophaga jiangningensis]SHL13358.1 FecR family protein [Chitinophaga jiangningensis]
MSTTNTRALFEKYYSKTATEQERKELAALLRDTDDQLISEWITEMGEQLQETTHIIAPDRADAILTNILHPSRTNHKQPFRLVYRYAAAAAVALLLSAGVYLLTHRTPAPATSIAEVSPGSTGAVLTLADGSSVQLDSTRQGVLLLGNGLQVQVGEGQLNYEQATTTSYNTLTVPRGRQYKVMLPDGTIAWLNADSHLRYPTRFDGPERRVELQGEAYFDVAQQATQPFIVHTSTVEVQALGTAFNINSYADEAQITTTLVSGAVQVQSLSAKKVLRPGQQEVIKGNTSITLNDGNVAQAIAWKEGNFYFDDTTLPEILRQFSRWYDVEVVYNTTPGDKTYMVMISRNTPLSKVLDLLTNADADVKFIIEGKKLIVTSN